jgi:hypothetical protein
MDEGLAGKGMVYKNATELPNGKRFRKLYFYAINTLSWKLDTPMPRSVSAG